MVILFPSYIRRIALKNTFFSSKNPRLYHYTQVWICPHEHGHIQAIGRDNKKRKQYIYHPTWVSRRQEEKFKSLLKFGYFLSLLREKIDEELNKPPTLSKTQIICSVLFLVDNYSIRIGNPTYAKQNKTYGATTLRKKHLIQKRKSIAFKFLGKNKHLWSFEVNNEKIIKIIKHSSMAPGYEIFKYYNEQRKFEPITSRDINEYLSSLSDDHFTAKNFRTWIANREFFIRVIHLLEKKNLRMIQIKKHLFEVANLLGHTPTICKTSYLHPEILTWIKNGKLQQWKNKNQKHIKNKNAEELFLFWLEELYQEKR
ncbi:DNA topoisomerase IB [Legionella sp. km772]|uniref:DNA topoisomerase IB n=1 Tax=Legionella sp. km772 TaxID=2498111 RepID=UPI000F8D48E0|nr:DNA topoisomerase IB [Legionella sp. km772]RUR06115.1 DNA topoisomerase IB [Legionella sp. km772]